MPALAVVVCAAVVVGGVAVAVVYLQFFELHCLQLGLLLPPPLVLLRLELASQAEVGTRTHWSQR